MSLRRPIPPRAASAWAICALALAGCQNVEYGWHANRPARAARQRPVAPNAQRSASASAAPATRPTDAPIADAAPTPSAPARPPVDPDLFRVDLVSEPDAEPPAGAALLAHTSAWHCGRIVEMLYPPLGSGGSMHAYYLIYHDGVAAQRAAEAARLVDRLCDPAAHTRDPSDRLALGMARLAELISGVDATHAAAVRACEEHFRRAAAAERDPDRQWLAATLAGRVAADLRFDFPAARELFIQAQEAVPADALERMLALWAVARTYQDEARRSDYVRACRTLTQQFPQFSRSNVFQSAARAAAESPP